MGGNASSILCCVPPHPSRYGSTPSPVWEKAFIVMWLPNSNSVAASAHCTEGFSLGRSSAAGGGEARNPPLPVADTGGCSANEATSFASVSVAKRLCRIARPHGTCACGASWRKCKQHFMLRSPSSVSLFARHLLPFWKKAFLVVLSLCCLAGLTNHRSQPRLIPASNHAPVARRF